MGGERQAIGLVIFADLSGDMKAEKCVNLRKKARCAESERTYGRNNYEEKKDPVKYAAVEGEHKREGV